jgi:hypothetical protein
VISLDTDVRGAINLQSNELDLQTLSQEHSPLLLCPLDIVIHHLHLHFTRSRWEVVDESSDWAYIQLRIVRGLLSRLAYSVWQSSLWLFVT